MAFTRRVYIDELGRRRDLFEDGLLAALRSKVAAGVGEPAKTETLIGCIENADTRGLTQSLTVS